MKANFLGLISNWTGIRDYSVQIDLIVDLRRYDIEQYKCGFNLSNAKNKGGLILTNVICNKMNENSLYS